MEEVKAAPPPGLCDPLRYLAIEANALMLVAARDYDVGRFAARQAVGTSSTAAS